MAHTPDLEERRRSTNSARVIAHLERSPRALSDWVGFVGFLLFAGWLVRGPASVGIFLIVPVVYEVAVAATFLARGRPQGSTVRAVPRIVAYGATFLIPLFVRWSLRWHPTFVAITPVLALRAAGALLLLVGLGLGFWPLWYLRKSFAVEPAARQLVTDGPYRIARHPIYASYVLNFSGLLLMHFTIAMAVVTSLWFAITWLRMRYEEQVLEAAFPDYGVYRQQVGALGPRFWHRDQGDRVAAEALAR